MLRLPTRFLIQEIKLFINALSDTNERENEKIKDAVESLKNIELTGDYNSRYPIMHQIIKDEELNKRLIKNKCNKIRKKIDRSGFPFRDRVLSDLIELENRVDFIALIFYEDELNSML